MKRKHPFPVSLFCVLMAMFLLLPTIPKADEPYATLEIVVDTDKNFLIVGETVTFTLVASGRIVPDSYGYKILADKDDFQSGGGVQNTFSFIVPDCEMCSIEGFSNIEDDHCGLLGFDYVDFDVVDSGPLEAEARILPKPVTAGKEAVFTLNVFGKNPPYKITRSVEVRAPGYSKLLFVSNEENEANSKLTLKMPEHGEEIIFTCSIRDSAGRHLVRQVKSPLQGGSAPLHSLSVNVQQEEIAENKQRFTAISKLSPPIEQAHFKYDWVVYSSDKNHEKTEEGSNLMESSFEFERGALALLNIDCLLPDGAHLYYKNVVSGMINSKIINELEYNKWQLLKPDIMKVDPNSLPKWAAKKIPRSATITLDNGKIIKIGELLWIKQNQNDATIKMTMPKQINEPSNMQAPSNMQHLQDINLSPSLNNPNMLNPSLQPPQGNIPNLNIPGLNLNNPNPPSAP